MSNKTNINLITLSLKKSILPIIYLAFTISLIVFSKYTVLSAKNGLLLWAGSVVSSLFPFFLATELLASTNIISYLGKLLNKFMKPIFNVPGEGSFPLLMGIISGYPIGAKIVTDLREKNILNKTEAERLLAFTNNSGPLFILGTVGISFFGDTTTGILLLITHILASLTVGILFRFWGKNSKAVTLSHISRCTQVHSCTQFIFR